MTAIRLVASGNKFFVPCVLRGTSDERLLAMVDTGASVTAVRGDICERLGLQYAGMRPVTCVHGSHSSMMTRKYHGTLVISTRAECLVVHELGWIEDEVDGSIVDAILGRDVLEGYRMMLDWPRMEGTLEA